MDKYHNLKIIKINSCKVVSEMWYKDLIKHTFSIDEIMVNLDFYTLLNSNKIVWKKDCKLLN